MTNQSYKAPPTFTKHTIYGKPLLLTECPVCEKFIPLSKGAFEKHCAEVNDDAHTLYEVMKS